MKTKHCVVSGLAFVALLSLSMPLWAHHSTSAFYDDKKSVTLKGIVTKYDWTNPHSFKKFAYNTNLPLVPRCAKAGSASSC